MYNWYNWPPGRLEPFPVQAAALYTSWLHPQKNIPVKLKKKSMQYTALIKTMILHFFHGIATQCEGLYVVLTWNPSHPRTNLTYISRPTFFGGITIYFIICFLLEMARGGGGVSGWASFFQPPHFVQLVQVGRVLTLKIHQFNSKDYKG